MLLRQASSLIVDVGLVSIHKFLDLTSSGTTSAIINILSRSKASKWIVGYERKLITLGKSLFSSPSPPALTDPRISAIKYVDHGRNSHLMERPPSEIAARVLWAKVDRGYITIPDIEEVSICAGGQRLRTGRMFTTPYSSGHRVEFAQPSDIRQRLNSLFISLFNPEINDAVLEAIRVYMEFLMIHPLNDGNGRVARLMFQSSLRINAGLPVPLLPLGPAFGWNRKFFLHAYLSAQFDDNAQPLIDFVSDSTLRLALLARKAGLL